MPTSGCRRLCKMEEFEERKEKSHMVLFPLMAQGHIIPFLELAELLAKRGSFIITFVTTPANIPRVEAMLPSRNIPDFRMEQVPFPLKDMPPGVENTDSIPYDQVFRLIQACEELERPFERLLQRLLQWGQACIISDMFFGWTLDVANRLGIPRLTFNTTGAFATSLYYSLWSHLPHRRTRSDSFSLPDLPGLTLHRSQLPRTLAMTHASDPWYLFLKRQIPKNLHSWGTLVNTFDDLEQEFLGHMRRTAASGRLWSVGPMFCHVTCRWGGLEWLERWLDSHPPASVLYVAFGTQVNVSAPQMKELAAGLEESQQPFVWAARPPGGVALSANSNSDLSEFLPEGFERRVKESNRGVVIRGWAPQQRILSHSSTGGFLSHCGWNSIMESLSQGVPIIGWPIAAEQFFNSKLLTEVAGVGVELCRGADGQLSKAMVESAVRMLMTGEKGTALRKRASDIRDSARKAVQCSADNEIRGSSISNVDDFIRQFYEYFI